MMRLHFFGVCIVILGVSLTQAQDWDARGQIQSRDTQIERRNGNVIEGTELVHYEYRVFTKLVPTDDLKSKYHISHDNVCQGKKHKAHEECDLSCDKKDTKVKKVTVRGQAESLSGAMRQMEQESAKLARKLGMPGGPNNWSSETSSYIHQMKRDCESKSIELTSLPHENPCTLVTEYFGCKKTEIHVKGEFWKVGVYRSHGVNTPINEKIAEHEGTVVNLWYPFDKAVGSATTVTCRCKERPKDKPTVSDKPVLSLGSTLKKGDPPGPTLGGLEFYVEESGLGCLPSPEQILMQCSGQSLTKCELSITNKTSDDLICRLPLGAEIVPEDSGTQVMTCTEPLELICKSSWSWDIVAGFLPSTPSFETATIRVACTELHKKEPSAKTKFTIVPPQDPLLVAILEQPAQSSFFANAIVQGRVWIYRDQASLAEINKRMVPGLTEGMYLNALLGLNQAGVDLSDRKFAKCVDANLLKSSGSSEEATAWFVAYLAEQSPNDLLAVGKYLVQSFAVKEAVDVRHLAHVADVCLRSVDPNVLNLGVSLLEKAIPAELAPEFQKSGGINALRLALALNDKELVKRAFAVGKSWESPEAKELLNNAEFFGAAQG
ncbi:MAG: hypothetical protein BGO01_02850 [Armatimonadetes bacterium 55-13]|nr:MAG: hypothetical protein BGO01_02850 [Armatimonadetes bacterium 55-13]